MSGSPRSLFLAAALAAALLLPCAPAGASQKLTIEGVDRVLVVLGDGSPESFMLEDAGAAFVLTGDVVGTLPPGCARNPPPRQRIVTCSKSEARSVFVELRRGDDRFTGSPAPGTEPAALWTVRMGAGSDLADGGAGSDAIYGDDGSDVIALGPGVDFCHGGAGNDTCTGGADPDRMIGGPGSDELSAGKGRDACFGAAGADVCTLGAGPDRCKLESGNDTCRMGSGNDRCSGGAGNDECRGGPGNDVLHGGAGDDRLFAARGNDRCAPGPGRYVLRSCERNPVGPPNSESFGRVR